jgi:hypothetical protein
MKEDTNITISAKGMGDEINKGIHASKSYVGSAVLTLILYYVGFYIVGLICNLVFLSQANQSQKIAGGSPSGRGCLVFLLWTHLLIPIILVILFMAGVLSL